MGIGLTQWLNLLPACFCVWLMIGVTDARPSDTLEASDWSTEWQQVADLWKPKVDKDKWRAFEPAKEIITTRWWEQTLDDDLWNPQTHESTTDKLENALSTQSQPIMTVKPVSEGGKTSMNTSETKGVAETTTIIVKSLEPGFGQPLFKKGEVNSFVEADPETYYRSSGEKLWDTSYSKLYHRKEPIELQESNKVNIPESKNATVIQDQNHKQASSKTNQSVKPDIPLDSKEPENTHDNKKLSVLKDNESADKKSTFEESPKQETAATRPASNVSYTVEKKVNVDQSKDTIPLTPVPFGKVEAASDEANDNSDLILENPDKNMPITHAKIADVPSEMKEKPAVDVTEQKASESVVTDSNAIYGKGERLAVPQTGAMNSVVIENMAAEVTKKPEEVTTKTSNNKFLDWDDWDNSAFDYYEDKDNSNEGHERENKGNKNKSIVSSSQSDSIDTLADDTDDDSDDDDYYDTDDEDDDADFEDEQDIVENENHVEITKERNGEATAIPLKINKNKSRKPSLSVKNVKGIDLKQSDEKSSHIDNSLYSKEVSYDTYYPNHKPSVKKDLTNPANLKTEENVSGSSKSQDSLVSKNTELQNVSVKKELGASYSQPTQLNTESDALTSPNPPTPGLAGAKESTKIMAPKTTPTSSSDEISLALANLDKQKSEVNKGFILSFPLEFCKVNSECRAGRTCVIGVCRCFTPSMCAGHHKPVCGSDGFQYPSHCELHRVACVNRIHIRADRRGKCFQKEIEEKEKSWLMQQERFVQSEEKHNSQADRHIQISSHSLDVAKDSGTTGVKEDDISADEITSAMPEKTTKVTVTNGKKECTWKEMGEFKEALLMHYCQKFAEPDCKLEVKTDREYLSMLMFSYCDKDYDYYLTAKELDDKERDEHFTNKIIINCHLHDFIKYADNIEADGKLTVSEFTNAFEVPVPSLPPHAQIEVIPTLATAGNGLELKCGIDASTVIWKRHGAQLSDDKRSHKLMVFDDGALFFSTIGLHHIGNYTCMDASDESKAQIHRLRVQTLPVVEVMPVVQTHVTGSDIELKCHAEGVPKPVITWKQGEEILQNSPHITHYYGGGHIVIHNAQSDSDTGTYTCSAHNQAGTSEKSVSVHVLPLSTTSTESTKEAGTFVVFHSKGISAYDPLRCLLRHQVSGDFVNFKFIPDALDGPLTLCHKGKDCQWKGAVMVGSDLIYVSQPDENRLVVMNAGDSWNPLQVIDTDKKPEKLWYVKHLDQVWVLCGNQEHGEGSKTVVVIRDASQHIQHRSVHTQPVGNHFDMVQDLFIAPTNDLGHEFAFGYVSHQGQKGLFKLSLKDMSYTKAIDLTNYGCVPTNIAFVPIGGHVVIQCISASDQHTLQLIMDYLTDSITSTISLNGYPITSPDSRHLVTVDQFTGKVIVTSVSDDGALETTYEVTVSASISDVAFMPAMSHQGYDLVLTSADDDDVIIMNLVTGKVEKIPGSQYSDPMNSWHPSPIHRHIISGNSMSNYLMAPSRSSLAILDAKFKQVECEFMESVGSEVMIYIPSSYKS